MTIPENGGTNPHMKHLRGKPIRGVPMQNTEQVQIRLYVMSCHTFTSNAHPPRVGLGGYINQALPTVGRRVFHLNCNVLAYAVYLILTLDCLINLMCHVLERVRLR